MYFDNRPLPPLWWRRIDGYIQTNWAKILVILFLLSSLALPFFQDAPTFYWAD